MKTIESCLLAMVLLSLSPAMAHELDSTSLMDMENQWLDTIELDSSAHLFVPAWQNTYDLTANKDWSCEMLVELGHARYLSPQTIEASRVRPMLLGTSGYRAGIEILVDDHQDQEIRGIYCTTSREHFTVGEFRRALAPLKLHHRVKGARPFGRLDR